MAKNSIKDIAAIIAKKHKLAKADAENFVTEMFRAVSDGLQDDKMAKVRGLGTFKVTAVKPRESVNVNTGERVVIEGHDKVSFTPDNAMKEQVNKPFSQFETVILKDGVNLDSVDAAFEAEQQKIEASQMKLTKPAEEPMTSAVEENVTESVITGMAAEHVAVEENDDAAIVSHDDTPKDPIASITDDATSEKTEEPSVSHEDKSVLREDNPVSHEEVAKTDEPMNMPVEDSSETTAETSVPDAVAAPAALMDVETTSVKSEEKVRMNPASAVEMVETPQPTVKPIVAEKTDDAAEATGQTIVINKSEKKEKAIDEEHVTREYFDEQMKDIKRHNNHKLIGLVVGILVGFVLGYFFVNLFLNKLSADKQATTQAEQTKTAGNDTTTAQPAAATKTAAQSAAPADTLPAEVKTANADKRLQYGAYDIVGIEKTVVLKKGQTMASYSRHTLGSDMVVYFQALNGVNEMAEGDTLKVPRVRLKAQYRK